MPESFAFRERGHLSCWAFGCLFKCFKRNTAGVHDQLWQLRAQLRRTWLGGHTETQSEHTNNPNPPQKSVNQCQQATVRIQVLFTFLSTFFGGGLPSQRQDSSSEELKSEELEPSSTTCSFFPFTRIFPLRSWTGTTRYTTHGQLVWTDRQTMTSWLALYRVRDYAQTLMRITVRVCVKVQHSNMTADGPAYL